MNPTFLDISDATTSDLWATLGILIVGLLVFALIVGFLLVLFFKVLDKFRNKRL